MIIVVMELNASVTVVTFVMFVLRQVNAPEKVVCGMGLIARTEHHVVEVLALLVPVLQAALIKVIPA